MMMEKNPSFFQYFLLFPRWILLCNVNVNGAIKILIL